MVTGEFPPMEGGVGGFTLDLGRAMVAQGHEVEVFTRAEAAGGNAEGIGVTAQIRGSWGWSTLRTIKEWVREKQLDLVDVQFQTAAYNMHPSIHWLPSWLREIPVIATMHDLREPYLFPKAGPIRTWVVRKLAQDADGVITSDRADEFVLRNVWHISQVCRIPIGGNITAVPLHGFDRSAWRASLGVAPDDLLISYFGFLNESKGCLVLIEALAKLVAQGIPARLVMIGGRVGASDPTNLTYSNRTTALITTHGLDQRVHWTGFVDDHEVSGHFYASDVTALPYLDGVSLRRGTLMAALAHGRAIVTTLPSTATPELEGAVEMVPPGDAEALAEKIVQVWRDTERRKALEEAALRASCQFSWEGIAQRTLEFFEAVRHLHGAAY